MKIICPLFVFLITSQTLVSQAVLTPEKDSLQETPAATVVFDSTFYDFGKARQGDVIRHVFHFTNRGPAPYIIQDVKTTCGCTVPEWSRDTVLSGAAGKIQVDFNTNDKVGRQLKIIRVIGNSTPPEVVLQLSGEIKGPKKKKPKGQR